MRYLIFFQISKCTLFNSYLIYVESLCRNLIFLFSTAFYIDVPIMVSSCLAFFRRYTKPHYNTFFFFSWYKERQNPLTPFRLINYFTCTQVEKNWWGGFSVFLSWEISYFSKFFIFIFTFLFEKRQEIKKYIYISAQFIQIFLISQI
jgi:hypothetical protein